MTAVEKQQLFNQLRHVHFIKPFLLDEIAQARQITDMSSDLTQITRAQGRIGLCQRMIAEIEASESAAKVS